jgi:O-methyltransferase
MRKEIYSDLNLLKKKLISETLTLVSEERFDTIDLLKEEIYNSNVEGDIVECGVWRGGMSIYLSHMFLDKKIWVCDSFEGFQKLEDAQYKYDNERHDENFDKFHSDSLPHQTSIKIPLDEVKNNFKNYNLTDENIIFLKGWVKDTLDKKNCKIDKICILRIDVDSYSATLEVLMNLYDKVVDGGYIIFDDSALPECSDAIKYFEKIKNIKFEFKYPEGSIANESKNGAYIKKNNN